MSEPKPVREKAGKVTYPVLPLRDIVVFPYMIVPLFVGREKSINALEEVMRADKQILLAVTSSTAIARLKPLLSSSAQKFQNVSVASTSPCSAFSDRSGGAP